MPKQHTNHYMATMKRRRNVDPNDVYVPYTGDKRLDVDIDHVFQSMNDLMLDLEKGMLDGHLNGEIGRMEAVNKYRNAFNMMHIYGDKMMAMSEHVLEMLDDAEQFPRSVKFIDYAMRG